MRGFALASVLTAASLLAAAPTSSRDATARRVAAGAGISLRLPHGWHIVRRSLTDVADPAQRLAVASFRVRLASHPCECGAPNIRDFPRAGAFLFVWEYGGPFRPAQLRRVPRRPAELHLAQARPHAYDCSPSWVTGFQDAGRVFQVEVHLGPAAGPKTRARMEALLDSLRVARLRSAPGAALMGAVPRAS